MAAADFVMTLQPTFPPASSGLFPRTTQLPWAGDEARGARQSQPPSHLRAGVALAWGISAITAISR